MISSQERDNEIAILVNMVRQARGGGTAPTPSIASEAKEFSPPGSEKKANAPARRLAHEARSLADQLMPLAVDRERLGAEVERLEAGQDVLRRQL